MVRRTQLTSTLTVVSNYIVVLFFLLPFPSSSDCRMTDGDTNLPPIERKLGLQIWSIEVGETRGNDGICPLHVYVFQERDIPEVISVGKEGVTDKIQWETGDPASPCVTFNMLLLWFPAL